MGLNQLKKLMPVLDQFQQQDMNDAQLAQIQQKLRQGQQAFPMEQQANSANVRLTNAKSQGEEMQNQAFPQTLQNKMEAEQLAGLGSFAHGLAFANPQGAPALIQNVLQQRGLAAPTDPNQAMNTILEQYGFPSNMPPEQRQALMQHLMPQQPTH